jgi:hypothetical protein
MKQEADMTNMTKLNSGGSTELATHEDIVSILGELDLEKILAILSLQPTIADLEAASLWLGGDTDVFGAGEPIKGPASEIVSILTADEEEEESRAG